MKIFLMLLMSFNVQAETQVGNGGDVVFCDRGSKEEASVELLDLYEARAIEGMNLDLGGDELTMDEKFEIIYQRIESMSFDAFKVKEYVEQFMNDAVFLTDVDLKDIPDSNHVVIPRGCVIKQIAIWKVPKFRGQKVYKVDKNLWDQLDTDNKVSLILHEVIYRLSGHVNSINTRYMVGTIISDSLENLSDEDRFYLLKGFASVGEIFLDLKLNGFPISLPESGEEFSELFFLNGQVKFYKFFHKLNRNFEFEVLGKIQKVKTINFYETGEIYSVFFENEVGVNFLGQEVFTDTVWFHKNGLVSNVEEARSFDILIDGKIFPMSQIYTYKNGAIKDAYLENFPNFFFKKRLKVERGTYVNFYSTGQVKSIRASEFSHRIQDKEIYTYDVSYVVFYKDGNIKSFVSNHDIVLKDVDGNDIQIVEGSTIVIDKNELVLEVL